MGETEEVTEMRLGRIRTLVLLVLLTGNELARGAEPVPRAMLVGHQSYVQEVAFSPDGSLLASAGIGEDPVRVWDVRSGKCRATFRPDTTEGYGTCIAFSPDGKELAIGSLNVKSFEKFEKPEDGPPLCRLRVWDLDSGRDRVIVLLRNYPTAISSVGYSPDGSTLAVNSGFMLFLWDVPTERVRTTLHVPPTRRHRAAKDVNYYIFSAFVVSSDSKWLATCGYDHWVRIWDLATGRGLATFKGHEQYVRTVAFSPDSKVLASGGDDKTVRVWPLATDENGSPVVKPPRVLRFPDKVSSLAYSPGGEFVAIACMEGKVLIYETTDYKEVGSFDDIKHKTRWSPHVAFAPDGSLLATCGVDPVIRLWDMAGILESPQR